MTDRVYGWRRDLPDQRDYPLLLAPSLVLPARVDLRPGFPPCYDQQNLGACTAHAIGAAVQYARRQQSLPDWTPSRLLLYYGERSLERTIPVDAGAQIRDGMKVIAKTGACPEALWPYDVALFAHRPPASAYTEARKHLATAYYAVPQDVAAMKTALAGGLPVVVGFTIYASFESAAVAATGTVPLPGPRESVLGGHAVLVVAYDDATQRFTCRNSWGPGWGDGGYFTLPYAYLANQQLAGDFWVLQTETSA